jgi:integrase/recombinase XerD
MKAEVSRYLDKRKQRTDGTYPVKIKVYEVGIRNRKYYPTGVALTEEDFKKLNSGDKLSKKLKDAGSRIDAKKVQFEDIIKKMDSFSFAELDLKAQRKTTDGTNVFYHFAKKIERLKKLEQIKTAGLYTTAEESFKKFLFPTEPIQKLRQKSITLHFRKINKHWLEEYAKWMKEQGNSLATTSMYLRNLRTIFNEAISGKDVPVEIYPFKNPTNKDGYEIRSGSNIKKALTNQNLKDLKFYNTTDPLLIKARDFWFFVFSAYGMNMRDICQLKRSDIHEDGFIRYFRQKTYNTTTDPEQIEVPITNHMQYVIDHYGTGKDYVFEVLDPKMNIEEKINACDRFLTFVNDAMQRLAKLCKIDSNCSSYVARHSFTTKLAREGTSMIFLQQALGHKHMSTTQNYVGKFQQDKKKEISATLENFD